jgi:16S rRNA U516 pseudouridylate synthase RsuA-like enzyme
MQLFVETQTRGLVHFHMPLLLLFHPLQPLVVATLTVSEGKHRMVRRMLANAGHPVSDLDPIRTPLGPAATQTETTTAVAA